MKKSVTKLHKKCSSSQIVKTIDVHPHPWFVDEKGKANGFVDRRRLTRIIQYLLPLKRLAGMYPSRDAAAPGRDELFEYRCFATMPSARSCVENKESTYEEQGLQPRSGWGAYFLCDGHVPLSVDVLKGNRMEEGRRVTMIRSSGTAQRNEPTWNRPLTWERMGVFYARVALGCAFLSAVADRFGLWGKVTAPFLAWTATVAETLFGILLILGLWLRWVALGSAVLLATFGTAMAISFGLKSPLDYSVFSASGAALLLALRAYGRDKDRYN